MKAKKNQGIKKPGTETQSTKLAEDIVQRDQAIQRLEQELLACQQYKETLNQTLLGYQQQPLQTALAFYQNEGRNYYINRIALPLTRQYENLLAVTLGLIAETQNQIQVKVLMARQFIFSLKQQALAYRQQCQDLLTQLSVLLNTQRENLFQNTGAKIALLQETALSLVQNILQKLNTYFPKLAFQLPKTS